MRALVSILLRLFPGPFRREFGADLLATFDDRWQEHPGWRSAIRILGDLAHSGLALHAAALRTRWQEPRRAAAKGDRFMTILWQDLRFAARTLSKSPAFTGVALATLALGIGANTAIYSVIDAVLFKGLPYPHLDRLVYLHESLPKSPVNVSWPDFVDWRNQNQVFTDMAAFQPNSYHYYGGDEPKSVPVAWVSSSFFGLLGGKAALGRTFGAEDDRPGAAPVAVLSYRFWRNELKSDPEVLGKAVALEVGGITVAGVLPPEFHFGAWQEDIYLPIGTRTREDRFVNRADHPGLIVIAEMRPGVPLARARADMDAIMERLGNAYPASNRNEKAVLQPLSEFLLGNIRSELVILLAAVAFVLLIACANVAHLALSRAAGRQREFAIRAAIGAGRGRLISQLLAESILLSAGGGLLGLLLAHWCLPPMVKMYPIVVPGLTEIRLDRGVLLFTLGVCVLAAVLFGLGPMLHALRTGIAPALRKGSAGAVPAGGRLRSILFVAEIAVAIVLTVGAGLLVRSLAAVLDIQPGFRTDHLLALDVVYSGGPARAHQFFQESLDRIARLPGVTSASAVTCPPPLGSCWTSPYDPPGKPVAADTQRPWTALNMVMPAYFQTMEIPLLAGRLFEPGDGPQAPRVAIINRTMARLCFPGESPVGRHVNVQYGGGDLQVVGVVGDVRQDGLERPAMAEVYVPTAQMPVSFMTVVVRTAVDPDSLTRPTVAAIRSVNQSQPVARTASMIRSLGETVARRRFATFLLGLFGALALILALVGVAGIMAYTVAQRTREFGIRLALGAQPGEVSRLVLRHGLGLTGIGVVLGLAAAWGLTRLLAGMMYQVTVHDPLTFAAAALLLPLAALLACVLPAVRAARVDPVRALRWE